MYTLFYNRKNIGDVLLINFNNDLEVTSFIKKDKITALYHDDKLIGYNIFDISKIVKIQYKGMIILPINPLIDVINSLLINEGFDKLDYSFESGYLIVEIKKINKDVITLSDGYEEYNIKNIYNNIYLGENVILIKNKHFTLDARFINDDKYDGELMIEDNQVVEANDKEIGIDYFKGE